MTSHHNLTDVLQGRTIFGMFNPVDVPTISFDDGSKITVQTVRL